jgi:hypothetical protein
VYQNFKHLLISIPKGIELNSKPKPKLILALGLGVTQYTVFLWVVCLVMYENKKNKPEW